MPNPQEGQLLPCPFCGARMKVRAHSSFHPDPSECDLLGIEPCWLSEAGEHTAYELDEHDYPAWNRRTPSGREGR